VETTEAAERVGDSPEEALNKSIGSKLQETIEAAQQIKEN
jgi:hypothetical protein